jgi:hypothetical protein
MKWAGWITTGFLTNFDDTDTQGRHPAGHRSDKSKRRKSENHDGNLGGPTAAVNGLFPLVTAAF